MVSNNPWITKGYSKPTSAQTTVARQKARAAALKKIKYTKDIAIQTFKRKGWYKAGGTGSGFPYRSGTCPHCRKGVKEGETVYAFQIDLTTPLAQKMVVVQHKDCLEALVYGESPLTAHDKLVKKWEEGGKFFE